MKFQTAYERERPPAFECTGESMTKQSHKDECDINKIIKSYTRAGFDVFKQPVYTVGNEVMMVDDVTFHQAMDIVAKSKESFEAMPSAVRKRFQNDPSQLMAFLQNADNYDEALKMGLVEKRPEPEAPPVAAPEAGQTSP